MGVVNVTPDSFSDGGVHLDPAAAIAAARRMLDDGAAIVDVGGESTRPGSGGVSLDEELRRVVPVLEGLAGRAGLDRHLEGRGGAARARARRRARQRRDRAARRPGARRRRRGRRRVPLPDAHAGRAADDAGRSRLRRRRLGGEGVPRGAARVRGRGRDPRGARLPRSRASASARRSSTTSSSCGGSTSSSRSAGRCSSASRARARSAGSWAIPAATTGTARGVGRRGGRGVRARRDDPPRARRARARRGAARGRRPWRAGA